MHLNIPTKFTKDEGIRRVRMLLTEAKPQLGDKATIDEERWDGDTLHFAFTAQGQSISGTLTVLEKAFDLTAKLPLMMKLFEGKIEKMISDQAKQMLQ